MTFDAENGTKKSRNKSPAFQVYPKDWLTDDKVLAMTPAEEGGYWRLLCIAWINNGTLPDDDNQLASLSRLGKQWYKGSGDKIRKCFFRKHAKLRQKRIEKEREKQRLNRKQKSLAGRKSAEKRSQQKNERSTPVEIPLQRNVNERATGGQREVNSSSSSSSAVKKEEKKEKKKESLSQFSESHTKKNIFSELPYNRPGLTNDLGFREVVLMYQEALDDNQTPEGEQGLRVNTAMVWAVYGIKAPHGTTFGQSERTIKKYLTAGFSIQELQKQIQSWRGFNNAPIWDMLKPLEAKVDERYGRQNEDEKLRTLKERQKERQLQDDENWKRNQADRARWDKEHPGDKFPGYASPEYIAWLDPNIPQEDLEAWEAIRGQGKQPVSRGGTKRIGELIKTQEA